jgi:hypothetical protein
MGLRKTTKYNPIASEISRISESLLETDTRTKIFNLYYTPTSPSKCINFLPHQEKYKGVFL